MTTTNFKKPSVEDITNKSFELLELIGNSNEVEIKCNDGGIVIDCSNINFTYIGKFGSRILSSLIKDNSMDNKAKKIAALAALMEIYSFNFGGFNIYTK